MAVKPIPDGYNSVTPYLVVDGVAALIDFLTGAFDAKERHRHSRPDGSIQHAEVRVGDSPLMMGEPTGPDAASGSRFASFYLYVTDCDAVYQKALRAGGTSVSEPADMPYGDRHGGVKDPSGNTWWIATHIKDVAM